MLQRRPRAGLTARSDRWWWSAGEGEGIRDATLLVFPLAHGLTVEEVVAPSLGPRVGNVTVLVLEEILEQLLRR